MSDDVVVRAKDALEDVTPAPWEVNNDGWAVISSGSDSVIHGYYEGDCPDCGDRITDNASVALSWEDRQFIADARTLVPELVAEVERMHDLIHRGLAYGDRFFTPYAAGARAELRRVAGMKAPVGQVLTNPQEGEQ